MELEKLKFDWSLKREEKGMDLEEKKFYHGMNLDEKKMELEKVQREKDQEFQRERFEREINRDNEICRQQFVNTCVMSGKTYEEINQLLSLIFPLGN